jgi:hypothetical protein
VKKILGSGAACAAMLIAGCSGDHSGDDKTADRGPGQSTAALRALDGCDDLAEVIRAQAIADMNLALDQQLESYLNSGECWGDEDGYAEGSPSAGGEDGDGSSGDGDGDGADSIGDGAGGEADGPTDVSETNNQVTGVDEADLVKSDREFLYITSNGALHILKAWPANSTDEVGKVDFEGDPRKLFVVGDRALVYVSSAETGAYCTYGYDCDFTGDGTSTKLALFDISDRTHPTMLREIALSGSLLAARRIGSTVHTVVSDGAITIDDLQLYVDDLDYCAEVKDPLAAKAKFDAVRAQNEAKIRAADVLGKLPQVHDTLSGASSLLGSCQGFYATAVQQGAAFTTLLSVDMSADQPVTTASVVSRPGAIYASADALYMSVRDTSYEDSWYYGDEGGEPTPETSAIHRFRIGDKPELTAYEASGTVPGHAINQFAMDEHEGNLRVATSVGWVPDPNVSSSVTVLGPKGKELVKLGQVSGIAPTEDIRSVRFDDDRGFIVTFKKTDPLFVLDLENPAAPRVLSELKIPGFSTYMHLMDEDHLLTIGYDADDQGDFAWFAGILLQIFDVSDPNAPKLAHKQVIGTRGSASEAATNHLAFNYFAKKGILAFPLHICEGGDGGEFGTDMTFNGLMVYDVSVADGFKERGRVAHPGQTGEYDDTACSQWWTAASTDVKRSVIMDDFVYSIANDMVKVQSLDDLGTDLASVSIAGASCEVDGMTLADDATWSSEDSCRYCTCRNGTASCEDYCSGGDDGTVGD